MKRLIIVLWIGLLLSGCGVGEELEDLNYVVDLNNELYAEIKDWYPIGTETYTTKTWVGLVAADEVPIPGKPNRKVIRYKNDKADLFITLNGIIDNVYTLHKVSHELPAIYSEQVEKLVLRVQDDEEIVMQGEVMDSYLTWLRNYYEGSKPVVTQCIPNQFVSSIHIYFKDNFPAYYFKQSLYLTKTMELCVTDLEGLKLDECVVLPEVVQDYILH